MSSSTRDTVQFNDIVYLLEIDSKKALTGPRVSSSGACVPMLTSDLSKATAYKVIPVNSNDSGAIKTQTDSSQGSDFMLQAIECDSSDACKACNQKVVAVNANDTSQTFLYVSQPNLSMNQFNDTVVLRAVPVQAQKSDTMLYYGFSSVHLTFYNPDFSSDGNWVWEPSTKDKPDSLIGLYSRIPNAQTLTFALLPAVSPTTGTYKPQFYACSNGSCSGSVVDSLTFFSKAALVQSQGLFVFKNQSSCTTWCSENQKACLAKNCNAVDPVMKDCCSQAGGNHLKCSNCSQVNKTKCSIWIPLIALLVAVLALIIAFWVLSKR